MNNMERNTWDKEQVKSRILKRAADIWGYKEGEMESFDPLVKLLIESFAGELERMSYEIDETQLRIIERMTGLISPDLDVPIPSYAVLQVRAVDSGTVAGRESQFVVKKGEERGKSPGSRESIDVMYSPAGEFRVYNGSILCTMAQGKAFTYENGIRKIPLAGNESMAAADYNTMWLGLDMEEDIGALEGMSFFFNWFNEPQKESFIHYLPLTEWFLHDGRKVPSRAGLNPINGRNNDSLEILFDISQKQEEQVSSMLGRYFITLSGPVDNMEPIARLKYPPVAERIFAMQDLKVFKKELYWLKIVFPEYCPPAIFTNMVCAMNCLPVLNRRIHRINYRTQQELNVIALDSADSFLAIKDVRNSANTIYRGIPLAALHEVETATYTIRSAINRLDQRQARDIIGLLLELLQDESASFAAIGEDFLSSQLIELNQNIARLDQRLKKQPENKSSNPYLVLNATSPGETVFIEYWSTQGAGANNIPSGSTAALYSGSYLDNKSTFLMSTTTGGKERPGGEQKINLLKKRLLSRDRIVTLEDIRIACREAMADKTVDIRISKIFEIGKIPFEGFIRTVLIEITPRDPGAYSEEEWWSICEDLKYSLVTRSTANWSYKVVVKR